MLSLRSALLVLLAPCVSGFTVGAAPVRPTACSVTMQTLTPGAPTIDVPNVMPSLPETWDVPDTFSFSSVPKSAEPPFFKITIFKASDKYDADFIAGALIKVIGLEELRTVEIAKQCMTLGFAVVGEYVQEVAEMYGEGLKEKGLVVDVSPTER